MMNYPHRSFSASLLVLLLQCPPNSRASQSAVAFVTGPSDLATVCSQLGFKVSEKPDRVTTVLWEKSRFGMLEKTSLLLKSKFPSSLGKDHFYRFTLWSETFPDSIQARNRLDSMDAMPPKLNIEAQYVYGLQKGYRIGSRVVFIQTDVMAYFAKVEQLRDGLFKLESIKEPRQRNRTLDSLSKALRKIDK